MSFTQIVGQEKQIAILRSALVKHRLHHGYLFVGPEGIGKRTVAWALAKTIHCYSGKDDFCGQCINCTRIATGNHPDVRFVEPLAGKKEISIQQIRDIQKELSFQSFTGGKKVVIFDPATLMNLSSQNALLKTLEEPPENSLLIIIAANAGTLLPTLRSRCVQIRFRPLEAHSLTNLLMNLKQCTAEEAQFFAALSMGSPGAALKLKDSRLFENRREWVVLLNSLRAADYRGASAAAEKLAANKEELNFLEWAQSFYRDVLVCAAGAPHTNVNNLDLIEQIHQLCRAGSIEHWLEFFAQSADGSARIQRNFNRRMVLEELFLNVVGAR